MGGKGELGGGKKKEKNRHFNSKPCLYLLTDLNTQVTIAEGY